MNFNTLSNWNMSPTGAGASFGMNPNQSLGAANSAMPMGGQPTMNTGIFSREGMFGQSGWVSPTINAATAGVQLWQGMQQLDLAKEQLAFQKDVFARNWTNQVQLTNQRMYDQYAARQSGYGKAAVGKDEFLATEGVN